MKIIEFIPSLKVAGAERLVLDLSNELQKRSNIEVILITLYTPSEDEKLRKELNPSIKTYSLNKKVGFSPKTYFQFYKLVKQLQPNIVHAHTVAINYILIPLLILRKIKFFMTIHNDAHFETSSKLLKALRKFYLLNRPNMGITISQHSKQTFEEVYKSRSTLIFNGSPDFSIKEKIDISQFKKTDKTQIFINVARIMPVKRQLMIAQIFNQLINEGNDICILFIGDEKDKNISQQLHKLANDRIIILGQKSNPRDYLCVADCFTLGSSYEGMPITLIEAFSVGCIPICTPAGGCQNMIQNGYNGLLSKDLSEKEYYNTIKEYLKLNDDEKNKLRKNAIKTYKEYYSIEGCADQHLKLFLGGK